MSLDFDWRIAFGILGLAVLGGFIIWAAFKRIRFGQVGQYFLTKNVRSIGRFQSESIPWATDIEALVIERKGALHAGLLVHTGTIYASSQKLEELIALLQQTDAAFDGDTP